MPLQVIGILKMFWPLLVLDLGLTIWAIVDLIRRPETAVRYLPKVVWVAIILLISVLGPIAYLVLGRDEA